MNKGAHSTSLPELAAILLARLGFLWLIVIVSILLPNGDPAFYAFMGVAFVITIPYSLWLRARLPVARLASLQFIADLVLVTGLVYFTGGVRSELTLLYPLVIISAGIIGTPRQAAEITVLAIVSYVLLITVVSNDWLIEYVPAGTALSAQAPVATILSRSVAFAFFGVAGVYVSKRCHFESRRNNELAEIASSMFNDLPTPAVLLDEDGMILDANQPLLEMLNTPNTELPARYTDLTEALDTPVAEAYGNTTALRRADQSPLPVAYAAADIELPDRALRGLEGDDDLERRVTLITFQDISRQLDTELRLERVERITSATKVAGEMAHEIRTPLTAISASVQLLKRYEEKTTAADWLPNSPKRLDRRELFEHIEDASARMNDAVTNFINFAEFSPQDLLSIIKLDSIDENKGYIGHLNTVGRGSQHGQNTDRG